MTVQLEDFTLSSDQYIKNNKTGKEQKIAIFDNDEKVVVPIPVIGQNFICDSGRCSEREALDENKNLLGICPKQKIFDKNGNHFTLEQVREGKTLTRPIIEDEYKEGKMIRKLVKPSEWVTGLNFYNPDEKKSLNNDLSNNDKFYSFKEIEKLIEQKDIKSENDIFQTYKPTGEEQIEISYIFGPNRSGKTYYAARYAKMWSSFFKDWPIYVFSRRTEDKVLDDLPNVNRIDISNLESIDDLSMDDFRCSLVIFDDIDTITDKNILIRLQKLRDDMLETGRQKLIYVINTSHLGMNWKPTRTVLNEANSYTLFPRKGNYEQNFKILNQKMGMKTKDVRSIIDKGGISYEGGWGWVTIYKDHPQYLVYENGSLLL